MRKVDLRAKVVSYLLRLVGLAIFILPLSVSSADTPSADYIFHAGGQRGTKVQFRVGAHYLHGGSPFEMSGKGLKASSRIKRTKTIWFEGPMIFKPASQGAETYPKDHMGEVVIDKAAQPGFHYWRLWTSQGAVPGRPFIVGDLPEVVEKEIDGKPVPVPVKLPVTVNGRMFPREDVDIWEFQAAKGESITCDVWAQRIGSPLNSHLVVKGPSGATIKENYDHHGSDSFIRFKAPMDGKYQVHIRDATFRGLQQYIYRLTITRGTHVDSVFPLGGKRGSEVAFELQGQKVPATKLKTRLPKQGADQHLQYFPLGNRLTNPAVIALSNVEEHVEKDGKPSDAAVAVPTVLNGRVDKAGQIDHWKIKLKKDESVQLALLAATFGSPLDGVLIVQDSSGKTVAEKASTIENPIEPKLTFKAPADGEYSLLVKDCIAERGGPDFAYRLKVDLPPRLGFDLKLPADVVTVSRGSTTKVKVNAVRHGGFVDEIELSVEGLPKGVTVAPVKVPTKKSVAELVFKAAKDSSISTAHLRFVGTAKIDGKEQKVTARSSVLKGATPREDVLLAVALPTPFKLSGVEFKTGYAARGTIHRRRYVIDWGDYKGDLTLSLADRQIRHQQGVQAKPMKVKNGTKEVFFPIQIPTWLEMNRTSRTVVMAVGEMDDGSGKQHKISFSSGAVDDQIILLTAPCPMAISAKRRSIGLREGLIVELPIKVSRGVLKAAEVTVELKLPEHFSGIVAEPVKIAADKDQCVLRIKATDSMGVINMPATVRATMVVEGDPVIAETKLDLVPVQSE